MKSTTDSVLLFTERALRSPYLREVDCLDDTALGVITFNCPLYLLEVDEVAPTAYAYARPKGDDTSSPRGLDAVSPGRIPVSVIVMWLSRTPKELITFCLILTRIFSVIRGGT